MITHVIASIGFGFLLISISYRHALFLDKTKKYSAVLISLLFAIFMTAMAWLGLTFSAAIKDSMFFDPIYASLIILLILSFKAYFNTRRSKLADAIFDIKSIKVLLPFAFATSFEAFLAYSGSGFLGPDLAISLLISGGSAFLFMWIGFLAGKRPNAIKNIRLFIMLAAFIYLIAGLSSLTYFF